MVAQFRQRIIPLLVDAYKNCSLAVRAVTRSKDIINRIVNKY